MAGNSGFSVTISAVDAASAKLDAVSKRIAAMNAPAERFNKSLVKFGDVTGINKLSEGFLSVGNNALGAFRAVERMAGPMASITSATSIAGIAALERHWSAAGNTIAKTAYALNMPVPKLSALEGGFQLAGSSAAAADRTVQGLSDTIHDAFYGRDANAISTLNALNIHYRDAKGNIADTRTALGELSDYIEQHADDPHRQMRALTSVRGDPDALPALRKGQKGLEDLEKRAVQTGGTLTEQMAANSSKINQDFERLELNLRGIGNRMANDWSGVTDRVLTATSKWIEKNQDLAESISYVGSAVSALSLLKPAAWLMRFAGLGAAVPGAPAVAIGAGAAAGAVATAANSQHAMEAADAAGKQGFTETAQVDDAGNPISFRNPKTGETKSWMAFDQRYQSTKPNENSLLGRVYRRYVLGQPDPAAPQDTGAPSEGAQPIANLTMTAAKRAFLATLGQPESGGRYDIKNGGSRFSDYSRFPEGTGPGGTSTASGRYQFISKTWHEEQDRLGLKDFSPENQDKAAWDLAWRTYAASTGRDLEADVKTGGHNRDITAALGGVWPSLPGGGQQQETQSQFDALLARNQANGQVNVEVTIKGAPPGTTARASSSGAAKTAPPRVETALAAVR